MALTFAGGDARQSVGISLIRSCLCLAILIALSGSSLAQRPPTQAPAGQRPATRQPAREKSPQAPKRDPAAAPKEEEEIKPPAPDSTYVRTKDGWSIYCTYYGPMEGVRSGKEVVPLILLHGWGGQGTEYSRFAYWLQSKGFALIVPDLRGHGRSTSCKRRDRRTGEWIDAEIKVDDLAPQDLANMTYDVEAMKKILMERHNKGELNIEMLCISGADVSAIVALNWAVMDWSWPVTPNLKQGQDVKGLILLSPRLTFKGLNANQALKYPTVAKRLSMMIAVGEEDRRAYSDAKRIYKIIEQGRETYKDPAEIAKKQSCFFSEELTTLQSTRLLDPRLEVANKIATFLRWRFLDKAEDYPWAERKSAL